MLLRRTRIKEKKKDEFQEWLSKVVQLSGRYNNLSEGQILDYLKRATFSKGSGPDTTQIRGTTGIQSNDLVTMTLDSSTHINRKTEIQTSLDGELVIIKNVYSTLESGLTYMAESKITVPGKEVELSVQNFSYTKN